MNNSWKVYKFSDAPISIIDGDRGKNYPKRNEFSEEGYCLFLNANNVTKEGFSFNSKQFITKEKDELLRSGKLSRGDVVMTTRGTIGNVAYYGNRVLFEHVRINSGMVIFRCERNKILPLFLFQYLRSPIFQAQINAFRSGVAQPQLPICDIKRMSISIPSLPEQYVITSILSAYDDLIENNTRRIQILEEMAQLIYREWFVNFRFPGHEKVKFVNSELGEIPEGWEVVKLEDIIENVKEKTEAGEHLKNREYLPIDCIPRKSFLLLESQDYTHAKSSLILFNRKDILFGNMRSYFHKVIIAPFDGVTRTTCFVLRPRNKNYLSYAYLTLFNEKTVSYSAQHSKGSTIPYAVWEGGLAEMKIIMPSRKIIDAFEKIISPILEISINTFFKLRNLRTARDLLLPKLISGEIDVSNWEVVGSRW